jgi:Na+-transporting methylmalonyl-CoA/oxaloacetate decarboxylase gamma subunit
MAIHNLTSFMFMVILVYFTNFISNFLNSFQILSLYFVPEGYHPSNASIFGRLS